MTETQPTAETPDAGRSDAGKPDVRQTRLGRSSLVMSLGTAASRASGLVRTMLLVACVGTIGTVADAFDIANKLPNMLFALLSAGVLQAVLIPQILKAMQAPNSRERLDKLLSISGLGLLFGTLVLVAAAPVVVDLMLNADVWEPEARQLAVVFAYWCLPQVFFYGLFMLLGQVLNAHGRFAAYGWAPVANNVVSLLGFGAFLVVFGLAPQLGVNDVTTWTTGQTVLLAGTATLGIATQALLLIVPLRRVGFRWRFRLGLRGIGLRSAGKVVGWTVGAVTLEQLGVIYLTRTLSTAGELGAGVAGNAAYTNALMIYLLPHSLVVVSIVTVLFPRMSAAVAAGDLAGVRRDMSLGMRSAGVFSLFSAAALLVLAEPLTRTLLPPASPEGIEAVAPILRAMAVGCIALGATVLVRRMYFAFEDGRGVFVIQIIATVTMVGAIFAAAQTLDVVYWAMAAGGAYALSTWVSLLLRVRGMRRKLQGMDGRRILRLYVRAGLSAVLAGGLGWLVVWAMNGTDVTSWAWSALVTVTAGSVMAGAYVLMLKLMRVHELDLALAPLMRRIGRSRAR